MARIGAMLSGFELQLVRQLQESTAAAELNTLRLASGQKVNRPADDPAAFVEFSSLSSRRAAVSDALDRVASATGMVAELQLTADQMRTQLQSIREQLEADEDLDLTAAERDAAQAVIHTAVQQINTLANTRTNGVQPLNGSRNFLVQGASAAQINEVRVFQARGTQSVSGSVTAAATKASLTYSGTGNKIRDDATFTLTGSRGSAIVTVIDNEQLSAAASRINSASHATGITASVAGNTLTFATVDYGTAATMDIDVSSGTFTTSASSAAGTDAQVTLNGKQYTGQGNLVRAAGNGVSYSVELAAGFSGALTAFSIGEGESLKFALSLDVSRTTALGLPSLMATSLGGNSGTLDMLSTGGALEGLGNNTAQAIRVVDEALADLTLVESQLAGLADEAIAASDAHLSGMADTLDEAITSVNGINEDEESLLLTRNQALAANARVALSVMAAQQLEMVNLLKSISARF